MTFAIDPVGVQLETVAEGFLKQHQAVTAARATLEADPERLPDVWSEMGTLGWFGLHLPASVGGQDGTVAELAVVIERLGRHLLPGPFLPCVHASCLIAQRGNEAQRGDLLPRLAAGATVASLVFAGTFRRGQDGTVSGEGLAFCAPLADLLLVVVDDDVVILPAGQVQITPAASLDPTRPVSRVRCAGVTVTADSTLLGGRTTAVRLWRAMAAAEAVGVARAATDMAVAYAKSRLQFGRLIGSFQAVKHHCANMLMAVELATAVTWDVNRVVVEETPEAELASASAVTLAVPAAVQCAQTNIQVHGASGFSWLHDAHLYLRRAYALQAAVGSLSESAHAISRLAGAGIRRRPQLDIAPASNQLRGEVRSFRAVLEAAPVYEHRRLLVESGFGFAHWPPPWGRGATAVEQLVIAEELAGIPPLNAHWIALTVATSGTEDQGARFVRPTLMGEIIWCQLFSEPDAGSDAAGIRTRGRRTDGGWLVSGQKVWTTGAEQATHGFATIRTDPNVEKHAGISMMVIDMHAPGVMVRPLLDLAGIHRFNEVFLEDVFVPDDDVVGPVDGGWAVARNTLGNERVTIGGALSPIGADATELLAINGSLPPEHVMAVSRLIATNHALEALNWRRVARAVAGMPPGAEGNATKLATAEHAQAVHELALVLYGAESALVNGAASERVAAYLFSRQHTIGGGTSEISRNQIGERLLGLPREPATK